MIIDQIKVPPLSFLSTCMLNCVPQPVNATVRVLREVYGAL